MSRRASVWVLWVGVAALALTDWMVGGSIAQERGGPTDPAVPTGVPRGADLTQSLRQPITIDGVRLVLETGAGGRYSLKAMNESEEPKRLALSVECWDTVGSPMSRMGPMPRQVASVPVQLALAAHETVTRSLALPPAPRAPTRAGSDSNSGSEIGWIATRDVRITVAGARSDARARAIGQLAARQAEVADDAPPSAPADARGAEQAQAAAQVGPSRAAQAGRASTPAPVVARPIDARQARRAAHGDPRVGS